jgi:hypothetical protein
MYDTQFRALAASNVLMWLAIGFGALPWWLGASEPLDWIVAAGMSAALISVSLILSGCVTRFSEATENKHYLTAGLTIGLGLVLVMIEAAMTHQGLAWIDARKDLAPDWALWVASFGLSFFNVFSLYTFARDMKRKAVTNPARMLAELRWKDKKAA